MGADSTHSRRRHEPFLPDTTKPSVATPKLFLISSQHGISFCFEFSWADQAGSSGLSFSKVHWFASLLYGKLISRRSNCPNLHLGSMNYIRETNSHQFDDIVYMSLIHGSHMSFFSYPKSTVAIVFYLRLPQQQPHKASARSEIMPST